MTRLLLIVLAAGLSACSSSSALVEPPRPLTELVSALQVKTLWRVDAGAVINRRRIPLTPLLLDGQVLVTDLDGRVSAYDRADGRLIWRRDLEMRVRTAPAEGEGRIYLVGGQGRILALNSQDGSTIWESTASSEVLTPPLETRGRLIVRSVDGRVQAWDPGDASPSWNFFHDVPALSLRGNSRPVLVRSGIALGLDDGRMVMLDPDNGEVLWERTLALPAGRSEVERLVDIDADPIVYRGDIYAGAYQGRIVRLSATGNVRWARDASVIDRPEAAGDNLFVTDANSEIMALDLESGTVVWRQDALRGRLLTAPLALEKQLVVADLEGYVHWLDQSSGRILARTRVDEYPIVARPVSDGETVYVHTQGGTLSALRLQRPNKTGTGPDA